jgi:hypothetical protein
MGRTYGNANAAFGTFSTIDYRDLIDHPDGFLRTILFTIAASCTFFRVFM